MGCPEGGWRGNLGGGGRAGMPLVGRCQKFGMPPGLATPQITSVQVCAPMDWGHPLVWSRWLVGGREGRPRKGGTGRGETKRTVDQGQEEVNLAAMEHAVTSGTW